jgi:ArsR family transcriptional regulator, arsenate/arsenite/antimonite-responsive transcriptional repressor
MHGRLPYSQRINNSDGTAADNKHPPMPRERHATMETTDALTALHALAQESRLTVFRTLVQFGPSGLSADLLASFVDAPAPALSPHLQRLLDAKLVSQHRKGHVVIYAARYDAINALLAYLMGYCCDGQSCRPVALKSGKFL